MAERLHGLMHSIEVVGLYGVIGIFVLGLVAVSRSLLMTLLQGGRPMPGTIISFVTSLLLLGMVGDAFGFLRSYMQGEPPITPVIVLGIIGSVIGFLELSAEIAGPRQRFFMFASIAVKLGALLVAYHVLRRMKVDSRTGSVPAG